MIPQWNYRQLMVLAILTAFSWEQFPDKDVRTMLAPPPLTNQKRQADNYTPHQTIFSLPQLDVTGLKTIIGSNEHDPWLRRHALQELLRRDTRHIEEIKPVLTTIIENPDLSDALRADALWALVNIKAIDAFWYLLPTLRAIEKGNPSDLKNAASAALEISFFPILNHLSVAQRRVGEQRLAQVNHIRDLKEMMMDGSLPLLLRKRVVWLLLTHIGDVEMLTEIMRDYISSLTGPSDIPKTSVSLLKHLIKITGIPLGIWVHEAAAMNAAKGIIGVMELSEQNQIVILAQEEISSDLAKREFPGHKIETLVPDDKSMFQKFWWIRFTERSDGLIPHNLELVLPYIPFKLFMNYEKPLEGENNRIRQELRIGARKTIVLGSTSAEEFGDFMKAYNNLYGHLAHSERPLVIVGFRYVMREDDLLILADSQKQAVEIYSDSFSPLPDISQKNFLILNTIGDLRKMYGIADVAVVGSDRNLFEPASQGGETAILYFNHGWANNLVTKEALVNAHASEEFSQQQLQTLMEDDNLRKEMASKAAAVVRDYQQHIKDEAKKWAAAIGAYLIIQISDNDGVSSKAGRIAVESAL